MPKEYGEFWNIIIRELPMRIRTSDTSTATQIQLRVTWKHLCEFQLRSRLFSVMASAGLRCLCEHRVQTYVVFVIDVTHPYVPSQNRGLVRGTELREQITATNL